MPLQFSGIIIALRDEDDFLGQKDEPMLPRSTHFWMKLLSSLASTVVVTLVPSAAYLPDLDAVRAAFRRLHFWRFWS
ncbi:MAG: hypothetical protein KKC57_00505 [Alphaproteobacteria bacterium]|jgi:hypothetical protein|nr:hypothetical protein [Alphaproteobacteria bacterium]|tara:strand:- start:410 stop:640 length:231 start_codon:yes stop_codon:yes gene_type:complete